MFHWLTSFMKEAACQSKPLLGFDFVNAGQTLTNVYAGSVHSEI
jgi:hypothetical protein